MNILIGDISSYKAITVAKFIHKYYPNIKIYGFDTRNFTDKVHTRFIDKNFVLKENSVKILLEIIKNYNIDFFIPVINESLSTFWRSKDKFNKSLSYLGDFGSYNLLNDKLKLHVLAEELQIKVPKRYLKIDDAKIPFIIKPTNLSSSKGVVYVRNKNDIPKESNQNNIIIQQFVAGKGVGFSFYCKEGSIIEGYGHKRIAENPISGGSSTYRSSYYDDRMYEVSSKIVKKINYTGFAMFEFKLTDKNELYLLEVNPRIWGSINQGMANGVNYFKEILGSPEFNITRRDNVHTFLGPLIYISFIKYLFKLNFRPIYVFLSNTFNNEPDINVINDPRGYLSTILRKILK